MAETTCALEAAPHDAAVLAADGDVEGDRPPLQVDRDGALGAIGELELDGHGLAGSHRWRRVHAEGDRILEQQAVEHERDWKDHLGDVAGGDERRRRP